MEITSGRKPGPRRILIHGNHKVGKSTFATSAPRAIVLNIEDGVGNIDCDKTEQLKTPMAVLEAIHWLQREKHDYATVVVDSIDWLETGFQTDFCAEKSVASVTEYGGGYGKGETLIVPKWKNFLAQIDILRTHRRMGIIFISHTTLAKVNDAVIGMYDKYVPDIDKRALPLILEWVDDILYAQVKIFTRQENTGFGNSRNLAVGGSDRVLITGGTPGVEAGCRMAIDREIPLSWAEYAKYLPKRVESVPAPVPAPVGNIAGLVVEGSSKPKSAEHTAAMAELSAAII